LAEAFKNCWRDGPAEDAAALEHFHATGHELSEWRNRHDDGEWANV
jgi:hypothetical protein